MNKQNKLARNAIRIRKAQAKRENEPNKPKKGRNWYSRLFALVGCLLLVSALVVPCFADDAYSPSSVEIDSAFDDYIPDYMHEAYGELHGYLSDSFYNERYFNVATIFSNDQVLPFDIRSDLVYDYTTDNIDVDYYVYLNYNNEGGSVFNCYFYYEIYTDTGDNFCEITLDCYNRVNDSLLFEAHYEGTTNGGSSYGDYLEISLMNVFSPLYNGGDFLRDQYFYIGLVGGQLPYSMSIVTQLLFYNSNAVNPYDWYQGAISLADDSYIKGNAAGREHGYADGYNEGFDLGEQSGYEYGYERGYNFGETNGFAAGQKAGYVAGFNEAISSGDAYQAGYDQAVSEIDSGEFGENLLGRMFNAPLQALSGFTLVELPMGEGAEPLKITLGSLLYLIIGISISIWFLKMCAGG